MYWRLRSTAIDSNRWNYRLWLSSLYTFLHLPVTSCLLSLMFLSKFCSQTPLCNTNLLETLSSTKMQELSRLATWDCSEGLLERNFVIMFRGRIVKPTFDIPYVEHEGKIMFYFQAAWSNRLRNWILKLISLRIF